MRFRAAVVGALASLFLWPSAQVSAAPKPPVCPVKGRALCVELAGRRVHAVENGVTVWETRDVRFGKPETPTPVGMFKVTWLHPAWVSPFAKGANPDMRWSVFTSAGKRGGVAFHQSASYPALGKGYRERRKAWISGGSHGCINLGPNDAKALYRLVAGWVNVDPAKGGNTSIVVVVAVLP